jgi:hypothetical protein
MDHGEVFEGEVRPTQGTASAVAPGDQAADRAATPVAPVPLVIGVTGHRDLLPAEIPDLERMVRGFLLKLTARYPTLPLTVLTPLAEGADRLVARVAKELGIPLIVPLPFDRALYLRDFETPESRAEFNDLAAGAEVFELPLLAGADRSAVARDGPARDAQYAQLGIFVCAHCHILLALWDGKPCDQLGGTGQVVEFHHWDVMPGFTPQPSRVRQLLADDESDLVYHIVCSRDRPDGAPADGLNPLQAEWFTTNRETPRTLEMPVRYEEIFARTAQFNEDAVTHAARIEREAWPLINDRLPLQLLRTVEPIDHLFRIADALAIHFQRRVTRTLRAVYTLAILMGLAFIAYNDVPNQRYMVWVFLLLFGLGVIIYRVAERRAWHRKYLDYRALAEGLRVQFYWACAGIRSGQQTKFAHDNFLQKQDVELGWIRNVMRVAGRIGDAERPAPPRGLTFAIDEWVGSPADGTGQLGYYPRKAAERTRLSALTERIGHTCLWLGIGVTVVLALFDQRLHDNVFNLLIVLMGILPLVAAVREAYAQKRAEKELIKQYLFMARIFTNARRQLDRAKNDDQRREILRALGNAALDEHAEWILMHRERPLEHGKL